MIAHAGLLYTRAVRRWSLRLIPSVACVPAPPAMVLRGAKPSHSAHTAGVAACGPDFVRFVPPSTIGSSSGAASVVRSFARESLTPVADTFGGQGAAVTCVADDPALSVVYSGGADGSLVAWHELTGHILWRAQAAPDGTPIQAVHAFRDVVLVWSLRDDVAAPRAVDPTFGFRVLANAHARAVVQPLPAAQDGRTSQRSPAAGLAFFDTTTGLPVTNPLLAWEPASAIPCAIVVSRMTEPRRQACGRRCMRCQQCIPCLSPVTVPVLVVAYTNGQLLVVRAAKQAAAWTVVASASVTKQAVTLRKPGGFLRASGGAWRV